MHYSSGMHVHLNDRNLRRAVTLALFVGLLFLFRHLALLFVFFVLFQRSLAFVAGHVARRTRAPFNGVVVGLVLFGLLTVALVGFLTTRGVLTNLDEIKASTHELTTLVQSSPVYKEYGGALGEITGASIAERAKSHAEELLHYLSMAGRGALYVLIALIISVVFLFERSELEAFRERVDIESVPRVILRYFGHTADAIAITFRLQFVVAVVNAVFTLPVLLIIGMPGIPALMALLVLSGLIPVVGGVVAGGVLMAIAFMTKGYVGLAVFVVWTFILHKLESYVLTPRLTAQHVKLPTFIIVVSLILFEHVFGLAGLFLSFPTLFVTSRIREGWLDPQDEARTEERTTKAMRGQLPSFFGGEYKA